MSGVDEQDRIARYSPEEVVGTSKEEGRSNKVYPMMEDAIRVSSANPLEQKEQERNAEVENLG